MKWSEKMGIKQLMLKSLTLIGTSLFMISTVVAQENSDLTKKILTLDYAISSAMDREEKVGVLDQQIDAYDEQIKVITDYASPLYYSTKYAQDSVIQQRKLLKDSVGYKVTLLYDGIIMLQKQIELNKVDIEIAEKEMKQVEIKNKNGQLSELSLAEAKANLEKKQAEQKQDLLSLEDYKNQFFNLTHIDIENYDTIEENLSYEPLDYPGGTDALIQWNVDYYLKNTEAYIAYQNDNIIDYTQYKYNVYTGIPENILKAAKAEVAQSSYDTQQQKKNMIESLQSCVAELEKLQQTIAMQQTEIENQKANLALSKIKYEHGYISQVEFQKSEQVLLQLELVHIQNIYTYQQQKMVLEKPWVKY